MKNSFCYFENTQCEYFPCHKSAGEYFNCMFCYCPLYALGDQCGGNFRYTAEGIKDCSDCLIPHSENGYEYIVSNLKDVYKRQKRDDPPSK